MTHKRYYQKGNPEKEPSPIITSERVHHLGNNDKASILENSIYYKPKAKEMPQAFFVIYAGGEKREKDYFQLIQNNKSIFYKFKIEFKPQANFDKGGRPSIIQFAKDKTSEYKKSANEENPDRYFLLTDVDHFKDYLPEMERMCVENDIELIISNSCFEVWLYYAEKSDRCEGFIVPENELKISSAFKTWAGSKIEGGLAPKKAIYKIEDNIKNAEMNYFETEDGMPTLFSTQMFRLAKEMLPYIKDGIAMLQNDILKYRNLTANLPSKKL